MGRREQVYTQESEYKPNGLPSHSRCEGLQTILSYPDSHGFPVMFQNNYEHCHKVANILKEGYYIDELTKDIRITLLNYNPYINATLL